MHNHNSRPPEPEHVQRWRKLFASATPRCCHTCDNYLHTGMCDLHNAAPPPEFAAQEGVCQQWVEEVPF